MSNSHAQHLPTTPDSNPAELEKKNITMLGSIPFIVGAIALAMAPLVHAQAVTGACGGQLTGRLSLCLSLSLSLSHTHTQKPSLSVCLSVSRSYLLTT